MARQNNPTRDNAWRGPEPAPILFLELAFVPPGATDAEAPALHQRMVNYDGEVEWAGHTWEARPFEVGESTHASQDDSPGMSITIADADGWWKSLLDAAVAIERKRVTIYRIDEENLTNFVTGTEADLAHAHRDVFVLDSWSRAHGTVRLELRDFLGILNIEIPLRVVTRNDFPGIPDANAV